MKKYVLIVSFFVLFLIGARSAIAITSGDSLASVWGAIDSLQSQITNLQTQINNLQPTSGSPMQAGGLDIGRIYVNYSLSVDVPVGEVVNAEANCNDSNDALLSGGYSSSQSVTITDNYPRPFTSLPGWWVSGVARGETGQIKAYASCYRNE